jgi:hypothetical protein
MLLCYIHMLMDQPWLVPLLMPSVPVEFVLQLATTATLCAQVDSVVSSYCSSDSCRTTQQHLRLHLTTPTPGA